MSNTALWTDTTISIGLLPPITRLPIYFFLCVMHYNCFFTVQTHIYSCRYLFIRYWPVTIDAYTSPDDTVVIGRQHQSTVPRGTSLDDVYCPCAHQTPCSLCVFAGGLPLAILFNCLTPNATFAPSYFNGFKRCTCWTLMATHQHALSCLISKLTHLKNFTKIKKNVVICPAHGRPDRDKDTNQNRGGNEHETRQLRWKWINFLYFGPTLIADEWRSL